MVMMTAIFLQLVHYMLVMLILVVTGTTRNYKSLDDVLKVIDHDEKHSVFGYSIVISKDRTIYCRYSSK